MKIFELLNTYPNQKVPDPDEQAQQPHQQQQAQNPGEAPNGKIDANAMDDNLQDIAQQGDDENAQPEPQGPQQEPPELDDQNLKPIDDALLSQIKSQPYVARWNVEDKSPIAPMKIAAMPIQELSQVKNMVLWAIQNTSMQNRVGSKDNDTFRWYNDLLEFVNTVMDFKRSNTRAQLAKTNPTPAYQSMRAKS